MKRILIQVISLLMTFSLEAQSLYQGKRVLSVGKSKKVLESFSNALQTHGFIVDYSCNYDKPDSLLKGYEGRNSDVLALGRGVSERDKELIIAGFTEENPAIEVVEGLAPVTNLLVDQIKLACKPDHVTPLVFEIKGKRLLIEILSKSELLVKYYHLNRLYMKKEKILFRGLYDKAVLELRLPRKNKNTFLVIEHNGVIANLIHFSSKG